MISDDISLEKTANRCISWWGCISGGVMVWHSMADELGNFHVHFPGLPIRMIREDGTPECYPGGAPHSCRDANAFLRGLARRIPAMASSITSMNGFRMTSRI